MYKIRVLRAYVREGRITFFRREIFSMYSYTYDKKGNWIERIEYEGVIKKPTAISTQTIEY